MPEVFFLLLNQLRLGSRFLGRLGLFSDLKKAQGAPRCLREKRPSYVILAQLIASSHPGWF